MPQIFKLLIFTPGSSQQLPVALRVLHTHSLIALQAVGLRLSVGLSVLVLRTSCLMSLQVVYILYSAPCWSWCQINSTLTCQLFWSSVRAVHTSFLFSALLGFVSDPFDAHCLKSTCWYFVCAVHTSFMLSPSWASCQIHSMLIISSQLVGIKFMH